MLRAGRWCEPARRKCWIYILLWKIEDSINTSAWSNMLLVVHDVISSSCWNVACKATFLWSWCLKHSWKWQIIGFNGLSSNIEFLLPFWNLPVLLLLEEAPSMHSAFKIHSDITSDTSFVSLVEFSVRLIVRAFSTPFWHWLSAVLLTLFCLFYF